MSVLTLESSAVAVPRRKVRKNAGWVLVGLNCAALLVVAVLFRVVHLGNVPGINGDEAWSGVQALRWLHGESIDWWTPTGNPINGFYFAPLVALHAIAAPSFELLRLTAVASGLLALAANFWLCRRAFDTPTAVISTWLLALLPLDIAYSRFAWDASQSLLATLVVMYLTLIHFCGHKTQETVPIAAVVALLAALWVHPTNLFAAPLLVVPGLYHWRRKIGEVLENTAVVSRSWSLAALAVVAALAVYGLSRGLPLAAARLHGPAELAPFAENYLRLFSGATVYEFISGMGTTESSGTWYALLPAASNLLIGCVAIGGLLGVGYRLSRRPTERDTSLVLGWLTMLAAFFVLAGPRALMAHFERYGICLIAPGVLVVSRGLAWWIETKRPSRGVAVVVLSLAAWLFPLGFYAGYFAYIEQTGGTSHRTFRTAAVEPKLQAFRLITEHRAANQPVSIVCREWWNYWPLSYLALGEENIRVLTWEQWERERQESSAREVENTWFVDFTGSSAEAETRHWLEEVGLKVPSQIVYDYGGRQLLTVMGPAEKFIQNN